MREEDLDDGVSAATSPGLVEIEFGCFPAHESMTVPQTPPHDPRAEPALCGDGPKLAKGRRAWGWGSNRPSDTNTRSISLR